MISNLLLAFAALQGAPSDLVVRTYELGASVPVYDDGHTTVALLPYLIPVDADLLSTRDAPEQDLGRVRPTEEIGNLVLEMFAAEFELDGRWVRWDQQDQLSVCAPPATQKNVERLLTFLAQTFARTVTLRVDVLEGAPPAGMSSLVAERDVEKLVADAVAAGRGWSETLRLQPGRMAVLERSHELQLVTDYNVEIAQSSFIHDPSSSTFAIGTRIVAFGSSAPGGTWFSLYLSDGGQTTEVRSRELRLGGRTWSDQGSQLLDETVSFQSPTVAYGSAALVVFVPKGQALVLSSASDTLLGKRQRTFVLRAAPPAGEPLASLPLREDGAALEVLDGGAFGAPRFEFGGPLAEEDTLDRTLPRCYAINGSGALLWARMRSGDLDWLHERISGREGRWVNRLGPWLLVYSAGSKDPAAVSLARDVSLAQSTPQPTTVDLVVTLRRTGVKPQELARWSGAILTGSRSAVAVGSELLAGDEVDVEVAQYAATQDVVVSNAFDGLVLKLLPARAFDGTLALELSARAHVLTGNSTYEGGSGVPVRLEQLRYENLFFEERLVFAPGAKRQTVTLGDGSGGGSRAELALDVELR